MFTVYSPQKLHNQPDYVSRLGLGRALKKVRLKNAPLKNGQRPFSCSALRELFY